MYYLLNSLEHLLELGHGVQLLIEKFVNLRAIGILHLVMQRLFGLIGF